MGGWQSSAALSMNCEVPPVKHSSGIVRAAALALLVGGAGAAPALAAKCASVADRSALETRMLQTELVVAALSCNERTRYNAFVNKFKGELGDRGKALKAFFNRAHGKDATRRLNAFVTELANEASQRTIAYQGDFCGRSEEHTSELQSLMRISYAV